jgi:hypothetical protein
LAYRMCLLTNLFNISPMVQYPEAVFLVMCDSSMNEL